MLRLKSLELVGHPILGDLSINFSNPSNYSKKLYITVLIGPNGTGKSYILQALTNIFREMAYFIEKRERNNLIRGSFCLKYKYGENEIEVANAKYYDDFESIVKLVAENKESHSLIIRVNSKLNYRAGILPKRLIASSLILSDKFPAVNDEYLTNYKYLGIRNINSPSTAGTRVLNRKVVDSLMKSLSKASFVSAIGKVLKNLDYDPKIKIDFYPKYRNVFFCQALEPDTFIKLFVNWEKGFPKRKNKPWGRDHLMTIKKDEKRIKRIVNFVNKVKLVSYGQGGRYFTYNLLKNELTHSNYAVIRDLQKLDLLSYPEIQLEKNKSQFAVNDSSSGEQNILFSLLNLFSEVEDGSLILIDEPEVSLHPNWQMKYIGILEQIFRIFRNLHFIIATHSQFLISGLPLKNSYVIGLNKLEEVTPDYFDDTYGLSAEEVLYRVFNVRTTRNHYLEMDLRKLLGMIARKSKEKNTMKRILKRVSKVQLDESDPLTQVIEEAQKYVNQ